jgi:hypothetical protein
LLGERPLEQRHACARPVERHPQRQRQDQQNGQNGQQNQAEHHEFQGSPPRTYPRVQSAMVANRASGQMTGAGGGVKNRVEFRNRNGNYAFLPLVDLPVMFLTRGIT